MNSPGCDPTDLRKRDAVLASGTGTRDSVQLRQAPSTAEPPSHIPSAEAIANIYRDAPASARWMIRARLRVCPFDEIADLVPPRSSLLDVGCGRGVFLALLASVGRIRFGFGYDPNPAAIITARQMIAHPTIKQTGSDLDFAVARVPPETPTAFDVVTMIDVMHHITPSAQRTAFDAALDRVRPGGIMIYKDMCIRPWWQSFVNRMHDLVVAREWITYVPIRQIEGWAAARGLRLETSAEIDRVFFYRHEMRVFRKPV